MSTAEVIVQFNAGLPFSCISALKVQISIYRLRQDCSHVGAVMFVLCDVIAEGLTSLDAGPATCTDIPCEWSKPKGITFSNFGTGK